MKTTLQLCIDEINMRIKHYEKDTKFYNEIKVSEVHTYGLQEAVNILKLAIEAEKKQICDAWHDGYCSKEEGLQNENERYYNDTY